MLTLLAYLWALPWTAVGACVGLAGLLSGGRCRCRQGVLMFHSGAARWFLEHFPGGPIAMTLGHVVLGQTDAALDITFNHELVHVRQYQRWGPIFIPAYLLCSFYLWLRGRDPYRENPFEKEAFKLDPEPEH